MSTTISMLIAREHAADLLRAADRRHLGENSSHAESAPAIELRLLHSDEADVVARLAALDDARELHGPVLLALIDGQPAAALSLHDQRVVANPFASTGEAVALLRLRAKHQSNLPARQLILRRFSRSRPGQPASC